MKSFESDKNPESLTLLTDYYRHKKYLKFETFNIRPNCLFIQSVYLDMIFLTVISTLNIYSYVNRNMNGCSISKYGVDKIILS